MHTWCNLCSVTHCKGACLLPDCLKLFVCMCMSQCENSTEQHNKPLRRASKHWRWAKKEKRKQLLRTLHTHSAELYRDFLAYSQMNRCLMKVIFLKEDICEVISVSNPRMHHNPQGETAQSLHQKFGLQ